MKKYFKNLKPGKLEAEANRDDFNST